MSSVRPGWSVVPTGCQLQIITNMEILIKFWLNQQTIMLAEWDRGTLVTGKIIASLPVRPGLTSPSWWRCWRTADTFIWPENSDEMRCWAILICLRGNVLLTVLALLLALIGGDGYPYNHLHQPSHYHHQVSYQELNHTRFFFKSISKNYFNEAITIDLCTMGLLYPLISTTVTQMKVLDWKIPGQNIM